MALCTVVFLAGGAPSEAAQLRPFNYSATFHDDLISLSVEPDMHRQPVIRFRIHNGTAGLVSIPDYILGIASFTKAPEGRVIVIAGDSDPNAAIGIFDERAARLTDYFPVWERPAVSPSGRYILFTKVFVEHPGCCDDVEQSNYAMIYDVSKSADENRHPDDGIELFNVGKYVYPRNGKREHVRGGGEPAGHNFMAGYYWAPDSRKAVFFDAQYPGDPISLRAHNEGNVVAGKDVPPSAALNLVLVDVASGAPIARKLDTGLCHGEPGSPACNPPQPKFTFGPYGVTLESVQTEQSHWDLHVFYKYSDFR
jgi:hypothetical protein